jgi:hypothetical protein
LSRAGFLPGKISAVNLPVAGPLLVLKGFFKKFCMRSFFYPLLLLLIFTLSVFTNWYAVLSISLMVVLLIITLDKIGKGIVLLETIAVLYVFTCIVMPLVGYKYYSSANALSRLWVKYMPVSQDTYFPYALPAITGFCLAITFPSFGRRVLDSGTYLQKKILEIKAALLNQKKYGLYIIAIGVVISFVANFLPVAFNYFAQLFFFGSFAGLLYIHFSPDFKRKKLVMIIFGVFVFWNAVQSGMFTIVAYMGITIFSFFRLGKQSSMLKKLVLMVATIGFFIVLQNVKLTYRKQTWTGGYGGNKVGLFSDLFVQNVQKSNELLNQQALFPLYSRTNQGYNVGLVMRKIPSIQNYDNGDRLLTVFASAFVPRLLWPDKPEAGGVFNMKYYAGYTLKGWSTNVGPLGEAYGSFGLAGGIIYMILLGFFLRWAYIRFFTLAGKAPLLIFWLPVLFYQTISSAETDSLQILNSVVKSAFFIWMLTKLLPHWFGIIRKKTYPKVPSNALPA